jgi:hypothetical protein
MCSSPVTSSLIAGYHSAFPYPRLPPSRPVLPAILEMPSRLPVAAALSVRIQLEPEPSTLHLAAVLAAVVHVLETSHASLVRQRPGLLSMPVMRHRPVEMVPGVIARHLLVHKRTRVDALGHTRPDFIARLQLSALAAVAPNDALVVFVRVRPVAAVGPPLGRGGGDDGVGDFLAVRGDVGVHFGHDIALVDPHFVAVEAGGRVQVLESEGAVGPGAEQAAVGVAT